MVRRDLGLDCDLAGLLVSVCGVVGDGDGCRGDTGSPRATPGGRVDLAPEYVQPSLCTRVGRTRWRSVADVSRFAPVHLPEGLELRGRLSQTFLRHFNGCPRSGFFYQRHRREAIQTVEMVRGTALHEVIERGVKAMVAAGESMIPPELVKAIVNEVLSESQVPVEEHDYIREMAYRWGREFTIDPEAVIACETFMVLDVCGYQVRCKVDFAQLLEGGAKCQVIDWKSGRGAPSLDDVGRLLDGRLVAKSFQLILYALVLAYGVPVRVTDYEVSTQVGLQGPASAAVSQRVEVPEPFSLAPRAQQFNLEFVYPGIKAGEDGLMLRCPVVLSRLELGEYLESLRSVVRNVQRAEGSGDWPAIESDAACTECPARVLCPIPSELRDHRGEINTPEQAREAAEVLAARKRDQDALSRELRAYSLGTGEVVRFGANKVREFAEVDKVEIPDKAALFAAVERARLFGEPLDETEFVKLRTSTSYVTRTLSEQELADEVAEGVVAGE